MKLPKARTADILIQETGKDLLVYDLTIHKAYALNETCRVVYQSCCDETSFNELKQNSNFSEEIIYLTLEKLKNNNLIEDNLLFSFNHLTRREAIKKAGLSSMIAFPMISSLVAPTAINAQSVTCVNINGAPPGAYSTLGCPTEFLAECIAQLCNHPYIAGICCSGQGTAIIGGPCGEDYCCTCA